MQLLQANEAVRLGLTATGEDISYSYKHEPGSLSDKQYAVRTKFMRNEVTYCLVSSQYPNAS